MYNRNIVEKTYRDNTVLQDIFSDLYINYGEKICLYNRGQFEVFNYF